MTSTSEVLNKAADLIEQQGWGQGVDTWNGVGGLCIEGAIGAALGRPVATMDEDALMSEDIIQCPAGAAVRAHLGTRMEPGVTKLFMWNDDDGRTAAEVIEVLRAAAVIEQAKEQQDAPVAVSA